MNKHPRPRPQGDPEEDDNPDDLPVINIDEDPDNANWLRILEQRRKEQEAQQQPPQKP